MPQADNYPDCIVNNDELLVILDFENKSGGWRNGEREQHERGVTDAFRKEALDLGISLSPYRSWVFKERYIGGCLTAFVGDPADPERARDDSKCMSRVASGLNTRWLLSGFVDPDGGAYLVEAQLVSSDPSIAARTLTFRYASEADILSAVHAAWLYLTSRR